MKIEAQREVWSELRSETSVMTQVATDEMERLIAETRPQIVEDLTAKTLAVLVLLDESASDDKVNKSLIRDALLILYPERTRDRRTRSMRPMVKP